MYRTVILRVGLHEYRTCSVTLREGHGLRVSENMVLMDLFRIEKIAL